MKYSVILPTFNEARNIVRLINAIIQEISAFGDYEILVMDDNSPDSTYNLVKETFRGDLRVQPHLRKKNRGLAASIGDGILRARGERLVVMDTDFTHDPKELPVMIDVARHFDIVSGSRFCSGGYMTSMRHYIASCAFNWVIRLVLRTQIQDNLGGFWISKREPIQAMPHEAIFYGYGDYFFRLLKYAQLHKLSVVELPSHYRVRKAGESKSNFLSLLFRYLKSLIAFRRRIGQLDPRRWESAADDP